MRALPAGAAGGAPMKRLLLAASLLGSGAAPLVLGASLPAPELPAIAGIPLAMSAVLPFASWWRDRTRRRAAAGAGDSTLSEIPCVESSVYLGRGFEWSPRCSEDLSRAAAAGIGPGSIRAAGADRESDLRLDVRELEHHVLLLGTTGTGKTRMLELLIAQAIRRGDAVAVVDPKGDSALLARVVDECKRAGRKLALIAPPYPEASAPYNPLAAFRESSEVADRVAAVLPAGGDAEPFRNFAWEAVETAAAALRGSGRPVTPAVLHRHLIEDPGGLVLELVREAAPDLGRLDPEKSAARYLTRPGARPELARLCAFLLRPREHVQKLLSALGPALSKLSSGAHRKLLSPERGGFSWSGLDRKRGVAYFFLGSLLGGDSASALARMTLLDFQSHAGSRYAWGGGAGPISLFVDELGDALSPALVHLLNKGRGAGIRVTCAAQTPADLETALGSKAAARQVVSNVNTVIQFRAAGAEDAEAFADLVGSRLLPSLTEGEAYEPAVLGSGLGPVDDFRAIFSRQKAWRPEPLVPAWAVGQLPRFEFFVRTGGRVFKGAAPSLPPAPAAPVEAIRHECGADGRGGRCRAGVDRLV